MLLMDHLSSQTNPRFGCMTHFYLELTACLLRQPSDYDIYESLDLLTY